VELAGRLTADPELKRIPSGSAVAELRMAVNKSWKTKDGDKREDVLYIDVTCWERLAETCSQYLKRGSAVFVEGSLKMDQWDDKTTGEKRTKLKVNGDTVQFLDPKPRDDGGGHQNGGGQRQAEPRGRGEAPAGQRGGPAPRGGGGYQGQGRAAMTQAEADDDDIPFSRPASFDDNESWGDVVGGRADDKAML
jgi:single-strand DNA-binding protein